MILLILLGFSLYGLMNALITEDWGAVVWFTGAIVLAIWLVVER